MTNPNLTRLALVVDRSGSMWSIRDDIVGGLESLLADQRELPGECNVDLVAFDDFTENVYVGRPVADATVKLEPRGSTALYDAVGKTVIRLGREFAITPESQRPGTVIVVVATDGFENASREFSAAAVKALVTEQTQTYNWKFVFLGANQDAVLTGAGLGFERGNTMTFATSQAGVASASASLNAYVGATRSGLSYEFSEEERAAATES